MRYDYTISFAVVEIKTGILAGDFDERFKRVLCVFGKIVQIVLDQLIGP